MNEKKENKTNKTMNILENLSNERRKEIEDIIEDFAIFEDWNRQVKKYEQEKSKKMLTIKHFLSMRLILEKIDFKKSYDDHIDMIIKNLVEKSIIRSNLQRVKQFEYIIKKNEPSDEFIIKMIITNILDSCNENQFELVLLNGQAHYFNDCYYVEINELLMKELLSDISKRNGVKNYDDYHFINSLYASFINKLIPFSTTGKSYKEKGRKLTKMQKKIPHEDCYFTKKVLNKPSVE